MERTAEIQMNQNRPGAFASNRTRRSTANAAAFGAVDIRPTIGAGAPSYTSGVHTWNGAEATLKPSPTNISATATYARRGGLERRVWLITRILVEPVAPNMRATPYRKNA